MVAQQKIRLLIVDDNKQTQHFLVESLGDHVYEIVQARSGLEALDLLSKISVDLIISGESTPGLSGHQLYALTRKRGNLVPFIMITGVKSFEGDFYYSEGGKVVPLILERPFPVTRLLEFMEQSLELAKSA